MYDNRPNSGGSGAVPGTLINPFNSGERRAFHYIENVFDPDHHPIEDLHKYVVPQEMELVFDVGQGMIYFVSHVDYQATLKSTLVPWALQNLSENNTTEQNWIFGIKGGPMLGEALLSVDFSVRPNTARVDATIMRPGAAYAKVFLGNDTGRIISAQYDTNASMINNKVPTKLAEIVDRTNLSIMTTGSFSVTENAESLPNGTRCMLVFYDEGGNFIPPAQPLMVQHSSYMRDHQIGIKYVTEIELISPWFSNTNNPERMMIPINVNLLSMEFRAVVHYSDGSQSPAMPVNGTKFKLHGLKEYRPTYPGQEAEVVLTYTLDPDEQHYLANPGAPHHRSRAYVMEAGAVTGAYSPKIFTYPQWDAALGGYRLQHLLYDLDRQTVIDVSDKVTFNDMSQIYRPKAYGIAQSLIFNLNLRDVAPTYQSMIFIQHTEVVLIKDVNGPGKRWEVNFEYGKPTYDSKFVKTTNNGTSTTFNLANDYTTKEQWLEEMYLKVHPSFDSWNEEKPMTPTHFDLMHEDGRRWRYSVDNWNVNNVISIPMQKGKTWYINWINKQAGGAELQLASTGVVVDLV